MPLYTPQVRLIVSASRHFPNRDYGVGHADGSMEMVAPIACGLAAGQKPTTVIESASLDTGRAGTANPPEFAVVAKTGKRSSLRSCRRKACRFETGLPHLIYVVTKGPQHDSRTAAGLETY